MAVSGVFRLYRPPADTTRYGRYGLILAESAWFGANRSRFGTNRAESARIREKKKKKKNSNAVRRVGNRVRRECGTSGAASVLSRCDSMKLKAVNCHKKIPSKEKFELFYVYIVNHKRQETRTSLDKQAC